MYLFDLRIADVLNERHPELNHIVAFQNLMKHADGEMLMKAVAFYCDWQSIFRNYKNDEDRLKHVLKELTGKATHPVTKSKEWSEALEMYYFLQRDPDRVMLNNLEKYYDSIIKKIESLHVDQNADLDKELDNLDRIYSFNQKALKLREQIQALKNQIDNTRSLIDLNIMKNLSYLEKRQLRKRKISENV